MFAKKPGNSLRSRPLPSAAPSRWDRDPSGEFGNSTEPACNCEARAGRRERWREGTIAMLEYWNDGIMGAIVIRITNKE